MTTGLPPSPTYRSIFGGIFLAILVFLAFLALPSLVKYFGAALTFLPGKLGLIKVVSRAEVISVDLSTSPTELTFRETGQYHFYTDNYDLLVVHDAVISSKARPWLKITSQDGRELDLTMIERGLAIYDTPLAKGRPVIEFEIDEPGVYMMAHPRRPTLAYIVPDYTSGKENWIIFLMIAQGVILAYIILDIRGSIRDRRKSRAD